MEKPNILGLTVEELAKYCRAKRLPAFRARQVYTWLHKRLAQNFDEMTDVSKEIRQLLAEDFSLDLPVVEKIQKSGDGSQKYLFRYSDGARIESVLMKTIDGRKTVCLSTQVGCALGCVFCATAKMGLKRDLSAAEIIGQAYAVARRDPDLTNLVYMGMGEPFLNYDNVLKSIAILTSDRGPNFGQRRITVSTCGIPEGIIKFAGEDTQVRLAVSLNTADDNLRRELMPIDRRFPLPDLRQAVRYYINKTGRRVTLEYIMIEGINDSAEALNELIDFCHGLNVGINLIPLNAA
ncbi:MAG: 23S rRNA (adenine(2503)-C(2))-methyltransferase RlmN, partial [Candidatus Margulisbacteria bacterium]|nr:23S rRNA (adenine(2503)-C(2))-methyltransferase RlmN [Candidatus Margulisiibacteriota bacterium]